MATSSSPMEQGFAILLENSVVLDSAKDPLADDDDSPDGNHQGGCADDGHCSASTLTTATDLYGSFAGNSYATLSSSICGLDIGEAVVEEESAEEHATPFVTPSIARASHYRCHRPDVPARMPSRQQSFRRQDSCSDLMQHSIRRQASFNRLLPRQASFRRQGSFRGLHKQSSHRGLHKQSSHRALEQATVPEDSTELQENPMAMPRLASFRKQPSFRKQSSRRRLGVANKSLSSDNLPQMPLRCQSKHGPPTAVAKTTSSSSADNLPQLPLRCQSRHSSSRVE